MTRTRVLASPPAIIGYGSVAGPMEGRGPMRDWFDSVVSDDTLGETSYEKSRAHAFFDGRRPGSGDGAFEARRGRPAAGRDLLDQIISASFLARAWKYPL